jgi:enamine deaminase RidA (YjgF/YER057c/UK114 family)
MARQLISSGSSFEKQIGYSRAVVTGEWVFVSGCTGYICNLSSQLCCYSDRDRYDYKTSTISPDVAEQAEQSFKNIESALVAAGATIDEIVSVKYILVVREDFKKCWPVLRKWLGHVKPAATMMVAGLLDEAMKIEIEVTARKGSALAKADETPEIQRG